MIFLYQLASLLSVTNAARILAVFTVTAKSHFACNEAMMKSLHAAGHHITLISPFLSEKQLENYTMIDSRFETRMFVNQLSVSDFSDMSLNNIWDFGIQLEEKYCSDVMKLKAIQEALGSTEKLFDIMFIELYVMYQCYLPIAEKLGIPVVGTVTTRSWKLADTAVGFPNNPAVVPLEFIDSKPKMTYIERLKNVWGHLITDYYVHFVIPNKVEEFYRKFYSNSDELLHKKQISMIFYNSHASLFPRPTLPGIVEVGGIHIAPVSPLPQDLQNFIENAEAGVILFTFGSVINADSLPTELRSAFVNAFAHIPQRVIWKFDGSIEGISDNVLLSSWVPQRDILDHKNVKAFISHCGMGGTYEAIHSGTPVVAIPIIADQMLNAAILEELGTAVRLDLKTVTTEKVLDALNTVLNDTGCYDRMQQLARVFKDRPVTPQESVVYWTEYIIKHKGALHLQTVGSDMPLYQYLLLDVVLLVGAILVAILSATYYILNRCYIFVNSLKNYIPLGKSKKKCL